MNTTITHLALGTHKQQHQVAWVHPNAEEIREFTVTNAAGETERMVKKTRKQASGEIQIHCEERLQNQSVSPCGGGRSHSLDHSPSFITGRRGLFIMLNRRSIRWGIG